MSIEEITKDKNLMRITWLTLSLTTQIREDELLVALSSIVEDYFIKYDGEWLEQWMHAADECAKSGDPSALLEMMAEATAVGRMITILEDDPGHKSTLH